MYTRSNRNRTGTTDAGTVSHPYTSHIHGADAPLLIPSEYRGEMLRHTQRGEQYEDTSSVFEDVGASDNDAVIHTEVVTNERDNRHVTDGIFDLLLGKNSSEEETVLLLGIALMLLSGHLDRRGTWGEDDLALLLIGYLLLG